MNRYLCRLPSVAFLCAVLLTEAASAQCTGCAAQGLAISGRAQCITVTSRVTIIRDGECDEDEYGNCFSNSATDQTCRFTYSMAVDVEGCCWQWKHEICAVANNGTRLGCATNNATVCGDNSASATVDFNCGTEWRASASVGGVEIGFVKMVCLGCLPPPV